MTSLLCDTAPRILSAGLLMLDVETHILSGPAGSLPLNPCVYVLLRELMRRPGVVLTHSQLIEALWPDADVEPDRPEHALRQGITRARAAMREVGVSGDLLQSKFLTGYAISGAPCTVLALTPVQAAAYRQMIATHPDRALASELAAC